MYVRNIETELQAALADTPVVLLNGARQTGKTTLVRNYSGAASATYVTLDDATQLSAARSDAIGFLEGFRGRAVIDEVQKAPELFPALKLSVDRDRRPGRFLLTGSANVLLLPQISESLAGRMELITLWPLSQGELHGWYDRYLDSVFAERLPASTLPSVRSAAPGVKGSCDSSARISAARCPRSPGNQVLEHVDSRRLPQRVPARL